MLKNIIATFIIIVSFLGCEKKDDFSNIIAKLKEQNSSIMIKHKTISKQTNSIQEDKKKTIKEVLVNKEDIKPKKKITNLTLKTTDGKNIFVKFLDDGIVFEKYKGKVVVLDIFTTWCPPCIESIPHINQLQKKYKKNLQVIGILMEEDKKNSQLKKFIKKYQISYPITNSKENFILTNTWGGISGYPTIIIFDKNGKYFNHYNGAPPLEMLENDIKKVLKR